MSKCYCVVICGCARTNVFLVVPVIGTLIILVAILSMRIDKYYKVIIIIISAVVIPLQDEGLSMFSPVFSVPCMFCPGRRPTVLVYFFSPSLVSLPWLLFPVCGVHCHSCSPSSICSSCHMTRPCQFPSLIVFRMSWTLVFSLIHSFVFLSLMVLSSQYTM